MDQVFYLVVITLLVGILFGILVAFSLMRRPYRKG